MGSCSASGRRVNVKSVIFMAGEHILSSNDFSGVGNRCRDDRVPVLVVPRGDFEDDLTAERSALQSVVPHALDEVGCVNPAWAAPILSLARCADVLTCTRRAELAPLTSI